MQDGLPQNSVNDMVQSSDGYLWMATFGGLARFDGVHFEVFDQTWGLPSSRVLALALTPDDSIWMGFEDGGLALRRPSKDMEDLSTHDLGSAVVFDLYRGSDQLWVATSAGVFVLGADGRLQKVGDSGAHGLGSDGGEGVFVYNEFATTHLSRRPVTSSDVAYQVLVEREDRHWRLSPKDLAMWDGQRAHSVADFKGRHWLHAGPTVGPQGALWFSVGPNLYRLDARADILEDPSKPLAVGAVEVMRFARPVRSLFVDREQNVWVGTDGDGVHRLTPQPFSEITADYGLAPESCRGLLSDGVDGYYVARDCQVVHLVPGRDAKIIYEAADCAGALALDHQGGLWFGGRTLFHYTAKGLTQVTRARQLGLMTAIMVTRGGVTYVGSNSGLWRLKPKQTPELIFKAEGIVTSLVEDAQGSIWAGLNGKVLKIEGPRITVLGPADGVPKGQVRAIVPMAEDEVWLGSYGGGITGLRKGKVIRLSRKNGLVDNFISALVHDIQGNLWVNSNQGVYRLDQGELQRLIRGDSLTLSAYPLPTGEGTGASPAVAAHLDQGTLAFATVQGVVEVRVEGLQANPVRPQTILESVRINSAVMVLGETAIVPPGRARLDAYFTAAMLRNPRLVSFEYRLVGVDAHWTEAGARRSAHYENLGPGEYCLVVRAKNENGLAGAPAEACFVVEPHLYERSVVQVSIGLLLLLLGWASHRWRLREINARNWALNAEVAQRQLAEILLSEREAHYRRVFETSVNGFILTDGKNIITGVNPAVCEMLMQPEEALVGRGLDDVVGRRGEGPPPTAHIPPRALDEVILCKRSDGTKFEARVTSHPFIGAGASVRLTTMVDVSPLLQSQAEEHRLREELLHSQRVEAIGVLAGGVAHDVNNMLTAVQGYAELAQELLREGGDPEEAGELIGEVLVSAKRTSKVTRQLLTYGRRQAVDSRVLHLSHAIRDIHALLVRGLSPLVKVEFDLTDNPACVKADPTQLEQVVVNLVINAIAAMPDGGTVRVSTALLSPETMKDEYAAIDAEAAHIRLRVEDEGVGMTDEVRGRIFDPFFTTKDIGKGTGLGLSGVYGIVAGANGHTDVQSQPGAGCRFDVLLPAIIGRAEDPSTVDLVESAVKSKEALIAYVDDDPDVRKTTGRILKRAGFRVVDFEDPAKALEALKAPEEMPQLLITDMVMPGMSGAELARRLMALHPRLPVLYISGYTAGGLGDLDPKRERFLGKPFSRRALIRAVQELLETETMSNPH